MRRLNIVILVIVTIISSQRANSVAASDIPYLYGFVDHINPIIRYIEQNKGLTCKFNTELLSDKVPRCAKFQALGSSHYLLDSVVVVAKKIGKKRQIRIKISDSIDQLVMPYFVFGKKILLSIDDYRERDNPKAWKCLTNIDDNLKRCSGIDKQKQGMRSVIAKIRFQTMRGVRQTNFLSTCNYHPNPFEGKVVIDYKKVKKAKAPKKKKIKAPKVKKDKAPKVKKIKTPKNKKAKAPKKKK